MFNTTPTFTLVSALVGAGTYAQALPAVAAAPVPAQAVIELQRARVDIYCGHNSQAVAGIRAASRQLRASAAVVPAQTFAALEEAAWLTRNDQYVQAEQALDKALLQITIAIGIAGPAA